MKRGFLSIFRGQRYRVAFVEPGTLRYRPPGAAEAFDCAGLMDPTHKALRIDGGLDPAEERQTIIHEVLHQVLAPEVERLGLDAEQEEAVVTYLGSALGAHVGANAGLWAYLIALGAVVSKRAR